MELLQGMINREKTGHLAWCALVAMLTARADGQLVSELQENLFITRWFALAKKQRRFSRDVATDINWILNHGRQLGARAMLRDKLDYLWHACIGPLKEQNDLYRLTHALEMLKLCGWQCLLLSDGEWQRKRHGQTVTSPNRISLLKSAVDIGFNDSGAVLLPLPVRVGGQVKELNILLKECGWQVIGSDNIRELKTLRVV